MSTDIRLSVDFLHHHKTIRLKRKLGNEAVLALIGLFCYAGKFRSGGTLTGLDAEDIADASGWSGGDAAGYVSALCEVGFIEKCEEGGYSIHEWATHQPWVAGAEDRKAAASKAGKASAEARKKSCNISECSTEFNGPLEPVDRVSHEPSNGPSTPSPSPSPSPKDRKTPPVRANALTSPTGGGKGYSQAFLAWWKVYPLKVKQPRAWDQWKITKGVDAKTLIEAVQAQAEAGHHTYRDGDKWPHPNKWLKDERWKDEIKTAETGGAMAWAEQAEQVARVSKRPQSPAERLLAETAVGRNQG